MNNNSLAVLESTKIHQSDIEGVSRTPVSRASLAPATFGEMMGFAQMLAKSSFVPKDFQGKPENVLVAIQWGMEIGLAPLQALQNIAVINGRPSLWGDAALAVVQNHPAYEWHEETTEGEGESLAGIFKIKRKGSPVHEARFTVVDAKLAHLWGKGGPWTQYPKRMVCLRARGFGLRDKFADALKGLITAEEARDYPDPPLMTTNYKGEMQPVRDAPSPQPVPVISSVAPFEYHEGKLRCSPVDAKERATSTGAEMVAIKFIGKVEGRNMAYCFHRHLFEAVLATCNQDSVLKVEVKKGGWPTIEDVISINGIEYDSGKPLAAPTVEELQKETLTAQLEQSLAQTEDDDRIPF